MSKKRNSLKNEFKRSLDEKYSSGRGTSRHQDKIKALQQDLPIDFYTKKKIYSDNSYKSYLKVCNQFCKYIEKNHRHVKSMSRAKDYLEEFVLSYESPYTQATCAAALSKAYGFHYSSPQSNEKQKKNADIFFNIKKRETAKIKKNRGFFEDADFIDKFNANIGLRRRELENLRGEDLLCGKDGQYYVHVRNGKGGKERYALVLDPDKDFIDLMKKSEKNLVFGPIDHDKNIHLSRQEYARRLYRKIERPLDQLSTKEKYICRGERKGWEFDRLALAKVSKNLGHNRLDVVVHHYWG